MSASFMRYVWLFLLFLTAMPVMSGCEESGYKTMSVADGVRGFSFEYPDSYRVVHFNLENTLAAKYTEVGLSAANGGGYSEIYVFIWLSAGTSETAHQMIDRLVKQANGTLTDFSLVDRSSSTVGQITAEEVEFTANGTLDESDTSMPAPRRATYRLTCMQNEGLAIEINMTCDAALANSTLDDYRHVLATFNLGD